MYGQESKKERIYSGVIQGSILGATLFLLYINDITYGSEDNNKISLYADDMSFLIKGKDMNEVYQKANESLRHYNNWAERNKLHINTKKTSYMIFGKLNNMEKKKCESELKIQIDRQEIKMVTTNKFLGLIIDQELKFKEHIEMLKNKIKRTYPTLYRIRDCIGDAVKKMVYHAIIGSNINYGILVYGTAKGSKLKEVQMVINRAVRILFKLHYRKSTDESKKIIKAYNVDECYKNQLLILTHSIYHKSAPERIISEVTFRDKKNIRESKLGNKPKLYSIRTEYGRRTLGFNIYHILDNKDMEDVIKYPDQRRYKKILYNKKADRKVP